MFCAVCGGEVVNTAVICVKCGSPLKGAASAVTHDPKYIKWGWVTALLIPIVGLGLGIYNAVKGQIGHGIGQIVVSIFMWSFWTGFFAALGGF